MSMEMAVLAGAKTIEKATAELSIFFMVATLEYLKNGAYRQRWSILRFTPK